VPFVSKLKELKISHTPIPYGQWNDNYARAMVFHNGELTSSRGLYVHSQNNKKIFKFIWELGALENFRTHPDTARVDKSHPAIQSLLSQKIFQPDMPDMPGKDPEVHAYIQFPNTADEQDEFEAALLETMIESAKEGNLLAITWVQNYNASIRPGVEELPEDADPCADAEGQQPALTNPTDRAQHHIDSLYEKRVQAEQEAISRAVKERTASLKPKHHKVATKGKTVTLPPKKTDLKADELAAKKAEILAKLKTQGRQKWGGLISLIMNTLSPHMDMIEFKTRGSHINIHIKGEIGSAGLTLIKPHGRKGGEIPAGVARDLATELVELVMKLSALQPKE
jgi:hypothetical protein